MECTSLLVVLLALLVGRHVGAAPAPAPAPRFKGVEPFQCDPGAVWMEACSQCRCETNNHVVCTHTVCLDDEIEAAVEAVEAAVEAKAAAEAAGSNSDVQRQFGFVAISRRQSIPRRR